MQENVYFCMQFEIILRQLNVFVIYIRRFIISVPVFLLLLCLSVFCGSCSQQKSHGEAAPWSGEGGGATANEDFDLDRIMMNGELIMVTLSGPETYYDYRDKQLGAQYMLCQKFADSIGVRLRVDVCRDVPEMLGKLESGDADVAAYPLCKDSLSEEASRKFIFCGAGVDSLHARWAVSADKPMLAEALDQWYKPDMLAKVRREESFFFSSASVKRRVHSPMLNRKDGIISRYDGLFMTYCQPIRWDWRLMAAQCYQESTFDPQAKSWAGACGLMQIMPATASALGLAMENIYDPEANIAAAARFLGQLEDKLSDIPDRNERMNFALACYNGGYHHIRDAMALAQRAGDDPHRWNAVAAYVLKLSEPRYYNDPIVKYGYMRGSETVDYVNKIRRRWQSYREVKGLKSAFSGMTPRKATHRKRKFQD